MPFKNHMGEIISEEETMEALMCFLKIFTKEDSDVLEVTEFSKGEESHMLVTLGLQRRWCKKVVKS